MSKPYDLNIIDATHNRASSFIERIGKYYVHYKRQELYLTTGFNFDAERDLWQIQYVKAPNFIADFSRPPFARSINNFFEGGIDVNGVSVFRFMQLDDEHQPKYNAVPSLLQPQPNAEMWNLAKLCAVQFAESHPKVTFDQSYYSANMIAYALAEYTSKKEWEKENATERPN